MSEQTALAMATEHPSAAYLDVATAASNLTALKMRHNLLVGAMKDVLAEGVDYGKIPGTGDKPTLLKAGAENLSFLFGLRPTFELIDSIEDWDRGLFYYRYRCTLHDGAGRLVANSEGSCNSRETKYRYRNEDRKCPRCGKATIIKGREQYGGGWLCYAKKGGCGAKFPDGDPVIEGQATGKVENTEPFELVNTLQKMAQKRALVAAVLVGTGASQFFTQDVEDMTIITVDAVPVTPKSEPEPKRAAKPKPAEESEEVADPEPTRQSEAPAPERPDKPKGTQPTRPYDPWTLADLIRVSIERRTTNHETLGPRLDNFKRAVVGNLEACFDGNEQARHLVAHYLTGKASSKDWDDAETMALHKWLNATEQDGEWVVDPLACQEAHAVYNTALQEQGQQTLFEDGAA